MPRNLRTIVTSVLITLVIVVVLQNLRGATIRFIVWDVSMPLALLLGLTFAAGGLTGWLARRR